MPIIIGTIPLNDSIDPKSPEITVGVNPGLNKLQRNYSTESSSGATSQTNRKYSNNIYGLLLILGLS